MISYISNTIKQRDPLTRFSILNKSMHKVYKYWTCIFISRMGLSKNHQQYLHLKIIQCFDNIWIYENFKNSRKFRITHHWRFSKDLLKRICSKGRHLDLVRKGWKLITNLVHESQINSSFSNVEKTDWRTTEAEKWRMTKMEIWRMKTTEEWREMKTEEWRMIWNRVNQ